MNWFDKLFSGASLDSELPEIFPFAVKNSDFVRTDIVTTYTKILTDAMDRVHGLSAENERVLWDSCVQTDASKGLITLLSEAMTDAAELFLVYTKGINVLRKATNSEADQIRNDYKQAGKSSIGVFVSFKGYRRTEMLKIYSGFEYCVVASLNKNLNVSKSLQLKISKLRETVSLQDAAIVRTQAKTIATALGAGRDVMMDAEDAIESAQPDTTTSEKSILFLDAKRCFYLGLPLSYVNGEQTPGIGSTGEADARAVERGLKQYYLSILEPVLSALFAVKTEFKSQDFRQITASLEVLKGLDLTTNEFMSTEAKQELVQRVFDLDPEDEKKARANEEAARAKANAGSDVQKQALNGAQLTSLIEVVSQTAQGLIPRDSAVQIVIQAFPTVSAQQANQIIGSAGRGFKPTVVEKPTPSTVK